jgi:microcystin-dependent protein
MQNYISQIMLFPKGLQIKDWAPCNGALLPVAQHSSLFALLGTKFGGDGVQTFGLPDLRDHVAIGAGQGPGLSPYDVGETGGQRDVTLSAEHIPSHSHGFVVSNRSATATQANGNLLANGTHHLGRSSDNTAIYGPGPVDTALAAPTSVFTGGGGQSHNNLQPYLGLAYYICIEGIFPPRG